MLALFKHGPSISDVRVGLLYRRVHHDNLVETARVLSVGQDSFGIPHVRFEVSVSSPSRTCFQDDRMLALETFARHYPEQVIA